MRELEEMDSRRSVAAIPVCRPRCLGGKEDALLRATDEQTLPHTSSEACVCLFACLFVCLFVWVGCRP